MPAFPKSALRNILTIILMGFPATTQAVYTNVNWGAGGCGSADMSIGTHWSGGAVPNSSNTAVFPDIGCGCNIISWSPFLTSGDSEGFGSVSITNTTCNYNITIKGGSNLTLGGGTAGGVTNSGTQGATFTVQDASSQLLFNDGADTNTNGAHAVQYDISTGASVLFYGNSGVSGGFGLMNLQDSTASMQLLLTGTSSLVRLGQLLGATNSTITIAAKCTLNFGQLLGGTFAGKISGAGAIVKEGISTATLTGTVNLPTTTVAGIQVTGGVLQLEGTTTGSANISGNGELQLLNAATFSGNITLTSTAPIGFDIASLTASSLTIGDLNGSLGSTINLGAKALTTGTATTSSTYGGVIQGVGGSLIKTGSGSLSLTGTTSTYTGGTTINAGTLAIQGDGSLGAANTAVTITGNSTLETLATFSSTSRQINLGANTLTFNTNGNTVTWNGKITGTGGLIKNGTNSASDILILGVNTNNYSGPTTITNGILAQGILNGFSQSSDITISSTGELKLNGFNATVPSVSGVLGSQISLGSNTLTVNSPSINSVFAGIVTGTNGNLIIGDNTNTTNMTLSNSGNNYTGSTTVANGNLTAGNNNVIASSSGLTLGTGLTTAGTFNLNGFNNSIKQLTGNSVSMVKLGSATLTIAQAAATTSNFSGTITDNGASPGGSLVFSGTNTATSILNLSGNNTYSGGTTVNIGTVNLTGNNTFGAGIMTVNTNGIVNINGGGTTQGGVDIEGGTLTVGTPPGAGTGTLTGNALLNSGAINIGTGGIMTGNATINGGAFTINNGHVTGNATINGGTLLLVGSGTISGNILINNPGSFDISGVTPIGSTVTIGNLATSGTVKLGGNTLNTVTSGINTFSGVIQDMGAFPGSGGKLEVSGTGTLYLTGINTYTGGTILNGGTLEVNADSGMGAAGSLLKVIAPSTLEAGASFSSTRPILLNSNLTMNSNGNTMTWGGVNTITGAGSLTKAGAGTLILTGSNSYSGGTILNQGTLQIASDASLGAAGTAVTVTGTSTLQAAPASSITSNRPLHLLAGNLTIDSNGTTMEWDGVIDGPGALTKNGAGTLIVTAPNTYSGGTTVSGGTLQGNTVSLQGNILDNATLVFDEPSGYNTFNGAISGSGVINKIGNGTLQFNTNQSGFFGTANVQAGTLALNSILGGNVNVDSGATLVGTGTVGKNLTTFTGGTISPGNGVGSIGTINVLGNFLQQAGSTYIWESFSPTQTDLINVIGTANIAGDLQVVFLGPLVLNTPYPIIHSDTLVTGTFANTFNVPIFPNPYIISGIFYTANDVFLEFKTTFSEFACNKNGALVAKELDMITYPTPEILELLAELATVPTSEICSTFDDLAGSQFTFFPQLARYSNERFNQAIYNTIRSTLLPCWCPDPCDRIQSWFLAETGHSYVGNETNIKGMKTTNWDFSLGSHMLVCNGLIVGIAANYQRDYINFNQGGHTTRNTGQAAVYGIARGDMFYLYGDAMFGMSSGRFKRPIQVGTFSFKAKSKPQTTQGLVYGEVGLNYCADCGIDLLIQPFLGAEYGHYLQKRFAECNAGILGLDVKSKTINTFDSYLGAHFFGTISCVNVSVDVAWQHRFNYATFKSVNEFQGFGSSFSVHGSHLGTDGVRGSANVSILITDEFNVYADFFGERWNNWAAHGADLGIALWW